MSKIFTGPGDQTVLGTEFDDFIQSGLGDDPIESGAGIDGGPGDDDMRGASRLTGGQGDDRIDFDFEYETPGKNILNGRLGDDILIIRSGADGLVDWGHQG